MKKDVIFVLSEESHGDVGYYTDANKAITDFLKVIERGDEGGELSIDYDDDENIVRMNYDDSVWLRRERLNYCPFVGQEQTWGKCPCKVRPNRSKKSKRREVHTRAVTIIRLPTLL